MNIYAPQLLKNVLSGQFGKMKEDNTSNSSHFSVATGNTGQKRDSFSIQGSLMEFLDPTAGMDENGKSTYLERIYQKIKGGKKLTPEEMNYLRVNDPELYAQAARVQAMRENLKAQMESCNSKEAVENAHFAATSMVPDEDPMKEAVIAACNEALKEFKKSEKYQSLPDTEEDDKKQKKGEGAS